MVNDIICETYRAGKRYSDTHKNGNRSSHRTDLLNNGTIKLFEHLIGSDFEAKPELRIKDARNKKFRIDLVMTKDGMPRINVLIKSIESSYNKNSDNYANGIIGETWRIYGVKEHANNVTVFVNYIPEKIPVKDKKGNIKNYEAPRIIDDSAGLALISKNRAFVINAILDESHTRVINIKEIRKKFHKIKTLLGV